jgi:hypothetical protein
VTFRHHSPSIVFRFSRSRVHLVTLRVKRTGRSGSCCKGPSCPITRYFTRLFFGKISSIKDYDYRVKGKPHRQSIVIKLHGIWRYAMQISLIDVYLHREWCQSFHQKLYFRANTNFVSCLFTENDEPYWLTSMMWHDWMTWFIGHSYYWGFKYLSNITPTS